MILSPLFMFHVFWHAPFVMWQAALADLAVATGQRPAFVVIQGGKV